MWNKTRRGINAAITHARYNYVGGLLILPGGVLILAKAYNNTATDKADIYGQPTTPSVHWQVRRGP